MKVLLADDQAMVRGALAALLAMEGDMEVTQVSNGQEAVDACQSETFDVAILDIEMPVMNGIEATEKLAPSIKCLIVTTFGRPGYLRRALEAGASGFIVKETPAEELATAVRTIADGGRVIDPKLAAESLFDGHNPLSTREQEILTICLEGVRVSEIASRVFLSEGTVRNHLSSAIQKTGTTTRAEAAKKAQENGWL